MKRPALWPDRSGPLTVERVERAIEFMVHAIDKYGDQYAPILAALRVDVEEMRRKQASAVKPGTKQPRPLPDRSEITDDTPLQLEAAARLAFPDGTMSALGLRNAAARGELEHERLGGRVYTTLAWIREWRERHRCPPRPRVGTGAAEQHDKEETAAALARAYRATAALRAKSRPKH